MRIILVRHFKVGFKWKVFYNSAEYEVDCSGYNTSPVVESPVVIETGDRLITSTMERALQTSRIIFQREPDFSHSTLCEVPIKPFVKTRIRFPKIVWDVLGRLQWRFNFGSQPESYQESKNRVSQFVDELIKENQNTVVVCHGWIIKLMIPVLKAHGFKGPEPLLIKNGVPYTFTIDK